MNTGNDGNTYLKNFEKRIADVENSIEELKTRHGEQYPERMKEVLRRKEELHVRWREFMESVGDAKQSGAEAWRHLQSGLESAYNELKRSIEKASEAVKS